MTPKQYTAIPPNYSRILFGKIQENDILCYSNNYEEAYGAIGMSVEDFKGQCFRNNILISENDVIDYKQEYMKIKDKLAEIQNIINNNTFCH